MNDLSDRGAVFELLRDHRPEDEREAGFLRRMLELAGAAQDPFARQSFTPGHFTASSFVLSPCKSKLLLILHGKLGLWLQPGGHFDPDERAPESAARREAMEETGLTELDLALPQGCLLDADIHRIPPNRKKGEPAHEHFDLRFLFLATSSSLQAGSDALEARWVPLEQVEDAGTDDSVRRAVRKIGSLIN